VVGPAGRGGIGGWASGSRATRVRFTSSVVGQYRHVPRWDFTVAPPSAVGRARRHRVHCSTGHPLSLSHHSVARPSGARNAGSNRSRRPVTSSWVNWGWGAPRRAHGSEPGGGRGGPGLGSTSPLLRRARAAHEKVFGGGVPSPCKTPGVACLFHGLLPPPSGPRESPLRDGSAGGHPYSCGGQRNGCGGKGRRGRMRQRTRDGGDRHNDWPGRPLWGQPQAGGREPGAGVGGPR